MNIIIQNGYWILGHLSNIELYYTQPENFIKDSVEIFGDEFNHARKIMRHKEADELYITNGTGKIFKSRIEKIEKQKLTCSIIESYEYKNNFENVTFAVPILKNTDRFEFALEKSVELGINKFIVFSAERCQSKTKKFERWSKILLAAMKQSLHSFLPQLRIADSMKAIELKNYTPIGFEQNSAYHFSEFIFDKNKNYCFIFGPEGGLSPDELNMLDKKLMFNLSTNRLRTETAVIKAASLLSDKIM